MYSKNCAETSLSALKRLYDWLWWKWGWKWKLDHIHTTQIDLNLDIDTNILKIKCVTVQWWLYVLVVKKAMSVKKACFL